MYVATLSIIVFSSRHPLILYPVPSPSRTIIAYASQCAAEKFGLSELKRLALKKQGLQSGITCSTILASARFAYTFTPDSDSRLRAHYLALIIRSRNTFKRSGTMQEEMERGGKMWFDLFVALVNHLDDVQKGR